MPSKELIKKIKNSREESRKLNYSFYLKEKGMEAFKEKCKAIGIKSNDVLNALIADFNNIENDEF